MTDISAARSHLCAWANKQPDQIRTAAEVVVKNLKLLSREPTDEMLLAQTKINVARLESLQRAARDGR